MKRLAVLLTMTILSAFAVAENAEAQQSFRNSARSTYYVSPEAKSPKANRPKLGIYGQMVKSGYKLSYVAPNSVAQRMGLEIGDTIMCVNDICPLSAQELITALDNSTNTFYNGNIRLKVENIRWHWGQSDQRYVFINGNLYR